MYRSRRNIQRNFDRQIWALQSLAVVPYLDLGHYEITKFEVEEWAGNYVAVKRERSIKKQDGSLMNIKYHELFKVGPRGKIETIYSNLY